MSEENHKVLTGMFCRNAYKLSPLDIVTVVWLLLLGMHQFENLADTDNQ